MTPAEADQSLRLGINGSTNYNSKLIVDSTGNTEDALQITANTTTNSGIKISAKEGGIDMYTSGIINATATQGIKINSDSTISSVSTVTNTTESTRTTDGAVVINGGMGIERDVFMGQNLNISDTFISNSNIDLPF